MYRFKKSLQDCAPTDNYVKIAGVLADATGDIPVTPTRSEEADVGAAVISTMASLTTPGRNSKAVQQVKLNLATLVRAGGAGPSVRKALHLCRNAWTKADTRSVHLCAREMEAAFLPCTDKPRKAIPEELKIAIGKFFTKEEVSRVRPHLNREILVLSGERFCKNKTNRALPGAELRVLQFMNMTLTKAYQLFLTEHPQFTLCQRTFEYLKPVHVRCASGQVRVRCACLVHVGAQMLTDALKQAHAKQGETCRFDTAGDILRSSYCPRVAVEDPFDSLDCITRKCCKCPGMENAITIGNPASLLSPNLDLDAEQSYRVYEDVPDRKDPAKKRLTLLEVIRAY